MGKQGIQLDANGLPVISAKLRKDIRAVNKDLYEQLDRFLLMNAMTGAELHAAVMDEGQPNQGAVLSLCMDEEVGKMVMDQLRDRYFDSGDRPNGNVRLACHRVLDSLLDGMDNSGSDIGSAAFRIEDQQFMLLVSGDDRYTGPLNQYVERLIFIEHNSEQLIPAQHNPKIPVVEN